MYNGEIFLPSLRSSQLGLLRRHRRAHHVPDVARCLVEEERHALAAEVLADDVELHAVLVDHVCDSVGKDDQSADARNHMQEK